MKPEPKPTELERAWATHLRAFAAALEELGVSVVDGPPAEATEGFNDDWTQLHVNLPRDLHEQSVEIQGTKIEVAAVALADAIKIKAAGRPVLFSRLPIRREMEGSCPAILGVAARLLCGVAWDANHLPYVARRMDVRYSLKKD